MFIATQNGSPVAVRGSQKHEHVPRLGHASKVTLAR